MGDTVSGMYGDASCLCVIAMTESQEPTDGGLWADAAKGQSAVVRASLGNQVAAKMDSKTVDSSSLEWSAAEEVTDLHGSPRMEESVPCLSDKYSVLTACIGESRHRMT